MEKAILDTTTLCIDVQCPYCKFANKVDFHIERYITKGKEATEPVVCMGCGFFFVPVLMFSTSSRSITREESLKYNIRRLERIHEYTITFNKHTAMSVYEGMQFEEEGNPLPHMIIKIEANTLGGGFGIDDVLITYVGVSPNNDSDLIIPPKTISGEMMREILRNDIWTFRKRRH